MFDKLNENIKKGASGDMVTSLQKHLVTLGYDVGPVDGKFGDKTKAAVVKFQDDHHLAADGIVGPTTGLALHTYFNQKMAELAQTQQATPMKGAAVKGAPAAAPVKGAVAQKGAPVKGAAAAKPAPAKAAPEKKGEEKKTGGRFAFWEKDD